MFKVMAELVFPNLSVDLIPAKEGRGRLADILSGMIEIQKQSFRVFSEKRPILLGPVRQTDIQNLRKLLFNPLDFPCELLRKFFLAVLRCGTAINRVQPFALIIVKRNRTAQGLSPAILLHQHASAIQTNRNRMDRLLEFRQIILPFAFLTLGKGTDPVAELLGIIAGYLSAVAFPQVLPDGIRSESSVFT
jgi:hypothetical protein